MSLYAYLEKESEKKKCKKRKRKVQCSRVCIIYNEQQVMRGESWNRRVTTLDPFCFFFNAFFFCLIFNVKLKTERERESERERTEKDVWQIYGEVLFFVLQELLEGKNVYGEIKKTFFSSIVITFWK